MEYGLYGAAQCTYVSADREARRQTITMLINPDPR
jgi:hypothetical protein